MTSRIQARAVLALAAGLALSCGGSTPSTSTPPATTTPTTTRPASGGGAGTSCALGNGSPGASCGKDEARLATLVETAINTLVQERPSLFDPQDVAVPNTDLYRVLDVEAYLDGVVANLRRQGACAQRDPADYFLERIQVKTSNASSETYDVLLSSRHIRRSASAYLETCSPASFPVEGQTVEVPPTGSGCGRPYPPRVTRFNCKVHLRGSEFYTVDSTPMVGPDAAYCAANGYTDGRSICPVRPEGAPDRQACENWRVGRARDTGRLGPTWTNEETKAYCTGPESNCTNNPDTQYQIFVYRSGTFRAADENGAYCLITVDR
jgi:hypothetical protein